MSWATRAAIVWTGIGTIVLLYVLGYVLDVLAMPVGIIIWTLIIVFCLRDLVNWGNRLVPRALAVTLSYVVMALLLALLMWAASSPFVGLGDQFASIFASIPHLANDISTWYTQFVAEHPELMENPQVVKSIADIQNAVVSWVQIVAQQGIGSLALLGTSVGSTLACIGFALVVAYWVLLDSPGMGKEIYRIAGPRYEQDLHFIHYSFSRIVGGFIRGTIFQCGVIAVGCMIAFMIMGIPNAMAFALICGLLNIIPVIGPWIGGVAAGLGALSVGPWASLFALLFTILIQQIVYTFISPKIMSNSVDVHPMIVILAMMVGMAVGNEMAGFMGSLTGMLLSIPLAAFLKSLTAYLYERRTGESLMSPEGVFFKAAKKPSEPLSFIKKIRHFAHVHMHEESKRVDAEKTTKDAHDTSDKA